MTTIVRQVTERAIGEGRRVELRGDARIILVVVRPGEAFAVALALGEGVRALEEPVVSKRTFPEELQRLVAARSPRVLQLRRRQYDRIQVAVAVDIVIEGNVETRIGQDVIQAMAAVIIEERRGAGGGETVGHRVLVQRVVEHNILDRALQVTRDGADANRPVLRHLELDTEDELILVHRLDVLVDDLARRLRHAIRQHRGGADLRTQHRGAIGIQAVGGIPRLGEELATGKTDVGVARDRQEVAAGVAEHLHRAVAIHVPREPEARGPLVLDVHEGHVLAVAVVKGLVTDAQVQQEVVGNVPVVFEVVRIGIRLERATDFVVPHAGQE